MPQLLRAVLCVIETFHKYAKEDEDKAALTCRELKQLLQGEIGNFLQPHVIHTAERHLNLLDIDNDGTINFDEFVLAIFSLLNLCFLDIQSLLNSEPKEVYKSEKEKPNDVDLQGITRNGQQMVETLSTQENVLLPSGTASSFQLSHEESEAVVNNKVNAWEDTKTHNLPREASEPSDPKKQYLEGDEQSQEVAQDVPETEDKRTQIKTNKPLAGSEQTSNSMKSILREGPKPVKRQSGNKTSDRFEEQEDNLKLQETLRPPNQEAAPGKNIKTHSETQEPPLQGENEPRSEHTDLQEQAAARKPSQTEQSANSENDTMLETPEPGKDVDRTSTETNDRDESEDCGKTSEIQESPALEREHEIKDLPVQGGSKDVSETPDIRAERKESRGLEAHGPSQQKEHEKKTQPPVLEAQTQDGKYQELQRSSKEKDAEKDAETLDLSTEERNQSCPETGGTSATGEEVRHTEDTPPALVNSRNIPTARRTAVARERTQESAPLERQSEGENSRTMEPCDKPVREEDGSQGEDPEASIALNSKGSYATPNSLVLEKGDNSSETGELHMQGDLKSQAHPHKGSEQRGYHSNPDLQKHGAPGENNRAQEAVVVLVREEDVHLPEEQKEPARVGLKSHNRGTKNPDAAVEPSGPLESQKSTTKGKNRKSQEAEVPGGLDTNFTATQLCKNGGGSKELKIQGPRTKEEDRAPEIQENLFKSPGEVNSPFSKIHLKAEEPATSEEENESSCEPAGKSDDQQNQTKKKYDSSVPLSGLEERIQREQKPCSVQRDVIQSSALYQSLQEKIQQARCGGSRL